MDDLYREQILEHYKQPHNWGEMQNADLEFEDFNPLCGDELKVQLRIDDEGRVADLAFSGHGCAISQAAASMASDEVVGMPVDDLLRLDREFILELLGIDISATSCGWTPSSENDTSAPRFSTSAGPWMLKPSTSANRSSA